MSEVRTTFYASTEEDFQDNPFYQFASVLEQELRKSPCPKVGTDFYHRKELRWKDRKTMLCTDDLCLDIYELIQNWTQTTTVEIWIKWICDHTLNRRRSVNVETKSPSHSLIIFFGAMNGPRKLVSLRETMLRGFHEQPNLGELDSRSTM